jgi:hypothetical protein
MMNEAQIKSVSLFFFYAFLEESVATPAINRALLGIQKSQDKNAFTTVEAATVYWTHRYWRKFQKKAKFINIGLERMYKVPRDFDLEPWKQLQKELTQDEFLVAIWSALLGFSHRDIAEGLSVSTGTVQHRIGIAFKKLGNLIRREKPNAKKRA